MKLKLNAIVLVKGTNEKKSEIYESYLDNITTK
jgi:hypothetical protein